MLEKTKGIISNDRITNDDLMSVPDDTIQMIINQSDIPCQLVIVCVFKEWVNLVYIYDVVLQILITKTRKNLITDRIQADGKGIIFEVIQVAIVR